MKCQSALGCQKGRNLITENIKQKTEKNVTENNAVNKVLVAA